jgi:hypothetical protein
MLHMLEGLAGSDDIDHQIAVLHELNTTLTMASGHQGQMRLGPALPILVGLLSSPSGEVCLLAVRALNTAIDIAPRAALTISAEGALPVLCRHLLHIADIDLAEQCLKCLQLVAAEAPRPVIDAGGLKACTAYFDFFPAALQRTALNTVATLCTPGVLGRKEDVPRLLEIIPLLSSLLSGGHDSTSAALSQAASLCLERLSAAFASPRAGNSSAANDRAALLLQQQQQLRRLESGSSAAALAAAEAAARSGKATQQPERWKAAFVLELGASSGVLTQWLGTLRGAAPGAGAAAGSSGGGSSSSSGSSSGTVDNEVLWQRQTQVLASLERMVATAPAVVASLYEKGGAAVLRDLLAEYVGRAESEAGRSDVAGDVAAASDEQQPLADGEARLLEILQLAAAMLPAPEDKGTGIELGRAGSDADADEDEEADLMAVAPVMAPPRSKQLQTEAAIAADAAVAAAMSEEWACRACTFVNSAANKLHCEMCTTLNPHARAAKAAAAAAGMHASPPLKPSPALSAALGLSSDAPPHFDLGAAAVAPAAKQAPLLAGHMVAEAAQVATLGDVYLHRPVYVKTYCETLLPLLLRLVPACSSPAVDAPVLRILSSLFALKAYPAATGGQGEAMAATLGQLLGTGGRDVAVKVKALELGLALLSERDDDSSSSTSSSSSSSSSSSGDAGLYRELFLRHGVVLQVQRSVSSAPQQPVKASKSKGKGKGRSKQQIAELPPAVVASSTVVHDAAYTAAAEAFLSAYEAGRSGKRQSSGETLESTALASLKQIAAALRAAAAAPPGATAEPAAAVVVPAVIVEQQKRGKKRARTAASTTTVVPTAVVSEDNSKESSSLDAAAEAALHALAQAVLSEHGITAFELEDSGVVPALVAYMLSSLPPPTTEAAQWLAERQARAHRLQAFAAAFMTPSSSSAAPVLPRFIAKVQDCLRAAADGLQVVRHGGASEQARFR